jgi:hypothetical protein
VSRRQFATPRCGSAPSRSSPKAGYLLANWTVHDARLWTYGNAVFLVAVALTREVYLWHLRRVVDHSPPVATDGGIQQ